MIWLRYVGEVSTTESFWDIYTEPFVPRAEAIDHVRSLTGEEMTDKEAAQHIIKTEYGWGVPVGKIGSNLNILSGIKYKRTSAQVDLEEIEELAASHDFLEVWDGRKVEYNEFNIILEDEYFMKMNFVPIRFLGKYSFDLVNEYGIYFIADSNNWDTTEECKPEDKIRDEWTAYEELENLY